MNSENSNSVGFLTRTQWERHIWQTVSYDLTTIELGVIVITNPDYGQSGIMNVHDPHDNLSGVISDPRVVLNDQPFIQICIVICITKLPDNFTKILQVTC